MENYSDETVSEDRSFMKMYDTLAYVRHLLCHIGSDDDSMKKEAYELICNTLASVSKRNYHVGTIDEQFERWKKFCQRHNAAFNQNRTCVGCPVYDILRSGSRASCELIWSHLSYEDDKKEGEQNENNV
jgi:hypothetical protein